MKKGKLLTGMTDFHRIQKSGDYEQFKKSRNSQMCKMLTAFNHLYLYLFSIILLYSLSIVDNN